MGPTASGKSDLAEGLADRFDAVLINADAFQMYRGLTIGTAKPACAERYELIDILDPRESFGVGQFVRRAHEILAQAFQRGQSAIVVGGTGLYIRALFEEYGAMDAEPDPRLRAELNARLASEGRTALFQELQRRDPEVAAKVDGLNPMRVIRALEKLISPRTVDSLPLPPFFRQKAALLPPTDVLSQRITLRTHKMVQNGWVQEVRELREAGYRRDDPGFRAIGYGEIWAHLDGEMTIDEAVERAITQTRQYAKRQRTWLRSEPDLQILDHQGTDLVEATFDELSRLL